MKLNILFLFLSVSILMSSCKSDKKPQDKPLDKSTINTAEKALKDISELSYIEIYYLLFTNKNGGFDAHGDLYGQKAVSNLSFSEETSSCGKALFLSNNSSVNTITFALKASFNFPGNPNNEMVRAYTIKANEKISVGNSMFCYNGKEYTIKREIISAGIIP